VTHHNEEWVYTDDASCLHIFLVLLDHGWSAHRAGKMDPDRNGDCKHKHVDREIIVPITWEDSAQNTVDQQRNKELPES